MHESLATLSSPYRTVRASGLAKRSRAPTGFRVVGVEMLPIFRAGLDFPALTIIIAWTANGLPPIGQPGNADTLESSRLSAVPK